MLAWLKRKTQPPVPSEKAELADVSELVKRADVAREAHERESAIALYESALQLAPADLYVLYWLAVLHQEIGDLTAAQRFCDLGLKIDPNQMGLLFTLASVASAAGDPSYALHIYERIAGIDAEVEGLDAMLADQYCFLGRMKEGIAAFDRALVRDPGSLVLQSNRLFVSNYAGIATPAEVFEAHRSWGERHEAALRSGWRPFTGKRDPDKPLRIGYVSPDLRGHAIAFFVEPLLRSHDKTANEIYCFDTSPYPEDEITRRLKSYGHVWRQLGNLDDQALADAIRSSDIDVLIDLSGHSTLHRLLTFARKPAPVQATWLGYLNTTGLAAMDYRITDDYLDPEGTTERFHTEKLFRIPNASCFQPATDSPSVRPLPAKSRDTFTFGSVNQWSKVTEEVKDVWARILQSAPSTRLVVVARGGQNKTFQNQIIAEFSDRGVGADRVSVQPMLPLQSFLDLFHRLDATLDPFPYGGGTTTMHSLWMGVPVVTLAGATAFSRNSIGPLTEVGLGHLVAATPAQYIEIAAGLSENLPWLADLRSSLRSRMQASPLLDEKAFARHMERAYRAMWRNYCSGVTNELRVTRASVL
jgi:protein O-GlcNAc transferase